MITTRGLNRAAMLAILPLMALAVVGGMRLTPRAAAEPPRSGILVVANLRAESLTFFDFANPVRSRTLFTGGPPHELALSGGRLYATLGRANALIEVELASAALLRTIPIAGEPHGLSLSGEDVLITTDEGGGLVVLDRATLSIKAQQALGGTPHAVWAEAGQVYVAQAGSAAALNATNGQALPTGAHPESLAVAGRYLVTANTAAGTVTVIDRESWRVLGEVRVGKGPVRVIRLTDTRVVVALNGEAEIAVVDLDRLRVVRHEKTLERPDGLCIDPSGAFLAVTSNALDAVIVFQLKDWRVAATIPAGDGPGSCAWLPATP